MLFMDIFMDIFMNIFMNIIFLYCQRFCHRPITFVQWLLTPERSKPLSLHNYYNSTTFKPSYFVLRRFGGGSRCISSSESHTDFRSSPSSMSSIICRCSLSCYLSINCLYWWLGSCILIIWSLWDVIRCIWYTLWLCCD